MTGYLYDMLADWRVEAMSTTLLGERFLRTLALLTEAAPEIGEFKVADYGDMMSTGLITLAEARQRIPGLVEDSRNIYEDDPPPDGHYFMVGSNMEIESPRRISWSASIGGKYDNRLTFKVGDILTPSDPDVATYPLFRAALLTTIAQWPSNWANAFAYRWGYQNAPTAPGVPAHPYSRFHMCWLSYLSAPFAAGLEPPSEILCERTPDGGLLMIAAEERLDPTNPDHMRRSRMIAEIMIARAAEPS